MVPITIITIDWDLYLHTQYCYIFDKENYKIVVHITYILVRCYTVIDPKILNSIIIKPYLLGWYGIVFEVKSKCVQTAQPIVVIEKQETKKHKQINWETNK